MSCNDIKIMINEYLDNELPKGKDGVLFTHLSTCSECRDEFRQQNLIQHELMLHKLKVPDSLEERIFNSIKQRNRVSPSVMLAKPIPVYISYILGIVILTLMIFSYFQISALRYEVNIFQDNYESAMERIQIQTQQMNLIMNNMPAVQITGNPVKLTNSRRRL